MSTASHPEPALAGSQPAEGLPLTAAVQKRRGCGRCMRRMPIAGGKRRVELGWVCAGCNDILQGLFSTAAPQAGEPKFTPCPAKGIAAGFDPRTQLPPGAQIVGAFMRDWLAKRAAA